MKASSTSNIASKRPAEESNDWRKPKRTFRPENTGPKPQVSTQNRYKFLSTDDSSQSSKLNALNADAPSKPKASKVPPILIDIEPKWTHAIINYIIPKYTKFFYLKYQGNKVACFVLRVTITSYLKMVS